MNSNLYSDFFSLFGVSVVCKWFIFQTQCAPPTFCWGKGLSLLSNFLKGAWGAGGLTDSQRLEGDCWEREGWPFSYRGCSFYIESKLKSEIFNDKKSLQTEFFFCLISNNLNWEILTNNLATFKRSDGVKDEKFKYYRGLLKNLIFKGFFTKNHYIQARAWTVCRFKGGLAKKEGLAFFRGRNWYPNAHYET